MTIPTTTITIHELDGQQAVILMTTYTADLGDSIQFTTKPKMYLVADGELVEQDFGGVSE